MTIPTFTDEQAELLDRGYPYLVDLVDGHPDDTPKKAKQALKKLVAAVDPVYFVHWPRDMASRFVWVFAELPRKDRRDLDAGPPAAPPLAKVAEWTRHVITRGSVGGGHHDYGFETTAFLLILEALHGTEPVLEAAVDAYTALAKIEAKLRKSTNYAARDAVIAVGALLWRAKPAAAKAARARLQELITPKVAKSVVFNYLDRLLGGKAVAERDELKFIFPVMWLFQDDDTFALKGIQGVKGDVWPDVRGAWVAGEDAIDAYLKFVPKVPRSALPFMIESFGMLKTPRVIPMMEALGKKKGGEAALEWLKLHAKQLGGKAAGKAKAPAKLAAAKTKKPTLAEAERELDELTDWLVAELGKVRGKQAKEAAVLKEAATRYMEIRSSVDEPAAEYLGHFFMVDGVGLSKGRTPAWERLDPTEAESERWGKFLDEAAS